MMDGTQVARCEQGQGGGRLSWDGWPATMNHTKCLRVDVVLGGFWTVDGGWLLGVGVVVVVVAVIPWNLDGAAALGGVDCCGNHGGIVMVMGFEFQALTLSYDFTWI